MATTLKDAVIIYTVSNEGMSVYNEWRMMWKWSWNILM